METETRTETDVRALHARAVPMAQRMIDGIGEVQLTAATPCPDWDVRAVVNHLVWLHRSFAAAASDGPPPDPAADLVGDDPKAAFADAAHAATAALHAPGALARAYPMPWGESDGESLARMLLADTVIHAWDLAKATGQPTALDPDLCEAVVAWGRTVMRPEYRTPQSGFGPEVPAPADAPACDRLAAFYGRGRGEEGAMPGEALDRLRAVCLDFPEATEQQTWGDPTFRVRGKIFAMEKRGDGRVSLWSKAPPGAQDVLVGADPSRFFVPPYVGHRGWIGVRLDDGIDWDTLADLVAESYRMTAPKRLAARIETGRSRPR